MRSSSSAWTFYCPACGTGSDRGVSGLARLCQRQLGPKLDGIVAQARQPVYPVGYLFGRATGVTYE